MEVLFLLPRFCRHSRLVDGTGSGLDADTLDGHDADYFQTRIQEVKSQTSQQLVEATTMAAIRYGTKIVETRPDVIAAYWIGDKGYANQCPQR